MTCYVMLEFTAKKGLVPISWQGCEQRCRQPV